MKNAIFQWKKETLVSFWEQAKVQRSETEHSLK